MRHSRIVRAAAVAGLCASPAVAHANSGIGFFTPASMLPVLGVIPVILVEAPVLRWRLELAPRRALFLSLWANLASTLGGAVLGFAQTARYRRTISSFAHSVSRRSEWRMYPSSMM